MTRSLVLGLAPAALLGLLIGCGQQAEQAARNEQAAAEQARVRDTAEQEFVKRGAASGHPNFDPVAKPDLNPPRYLPPNAEVTTSQQVARWCRQS